MVLNIVIVGVGGQGLLSMAQLIGWASVESGTNVLVAETHGLSQRGGSVIVHVRLGDASSPLIPVGRGNIMLALELLEAARYVNYMRNDGVAVVNKKLIKPNIPGVRVEREENVINTLKGTVKNTYFIDASTKALEEGKLKNEYAVLSFAGGTTAAATTFILGLDGFTVPMVVDLVTKRFFNYVQKYPGRGQAAELHNVDFMDMLVRGEKIIAPPPIGKGGILKGVKLDFSPILENEVIMNPQRYTYPGCAITVRFSALMRLADFPCLLTSEPVTATVNTYIVALHPDVPVSPPLICKDCAVARLMSGRRFHCYYRVGVAKEKPLY